MSTKQTDEERQAALQNDTDTTPLEGSPELSDPPGFVPVPEKAKGLPKDVPLRVSHADSDLIVSEVDDRKFRRQFDADEDGVEITGTESWVEV